MIRPGPSPALIQAEQLIGEAIALLHSADERQIADLCATLHSDVRRTIGLRFSDTASAPPASEA